MPRNTKEQRLEEESFTTQGISYDGKKADCINSRDIKAIQKNSQWL